MFEDIVASTAPLLYTQPQLSKYMEYNQPVPYQNVGDFTEIEYSMEDIAHFEQVQMQSHLQQVQQQELPQECSSECRRNEEELEKFCMDSTFISNLDLNQSQYQWEEFDNDLEMQDDDDFKTFFFESSIAG